VELRHYLRVLRRRWMIVAATTIVVVASAAAFNAATVPQYASTAQLFITTQQGDTPTDAYQGGLFSAQRVTSYADLVKKSTVLAETVRDELELPETPAELRAHVTANVVPDTVNLEVTVTDADPAVAQAKAQAYAEGLEDLIRQLEKPEGESTALVKATIVDPANLPTSPVSPKPVRNLALGFVLGMLSGVGLALVRDMLDTSVKAPDDAVEVTAVPVLGEIAFDAAARQTPLITALSSHAPRVEAFRVLRTNLQFVEVDHPDKVFVVTSAVPEEGKTTSAVNLAITMAQAGHRTLLIEGDLRRPKATNALGLDYAVGVTTVLLGKVSLDDAIQKHAESDLDVLASGSIPPNPAELLQSNAMADLLKQIRDRYDMVIIDAPPLLPVTDAALLASQADGALLVARYGKTTKDQLAQSVERLRQVDARPVGVVLNMVPNKRRAYGYGYGYGYGYSPEKPTA
jgi:tyrosine-protein kinase